MNDPGDDRTTPPSATWISRLALWVGAGGIVLGVLGVVMFFYLTPRTVYVGEGISDRSVERQLDAAYDSRGSAPFRRDIDVRQEGDQYFADFVETIESGDGGWWLLGGLGGAVLGIAGGIALLLLEDRVQGRRTRPRNRPRTG